VRTLGAAEEGGIPTISLCSQLGGPSWAEVRDSAGAGTTKKGHWEIG
jgi:hypothetical protein